MLSDDYMEEMEMNDDKVMPGFYPSPKGLHSRKDMIELERRAHAHVDYCTKCQVLGDALRHLGQLGLGRRRELDKGTDYMGRSTT